MLPTQIVFILNFFDFCGFNSGSSRLSQRPQITYIIYSMHILMAIILTLFEYRLMDVYYPLLSLSEAISESLQYSAALYTYWIIILDSVVHRRAHRHFWTVLQRIDRCFSCQPKRDISGYTTKLIIYALKTLCVIVIRLTVSSFVGFSVDLAYMILYMICEARMFYYLFCLEVLYLQLQIVEDEIIMMMTTLKASTSRESQKQRIDVISVCYSFELQRLRWIRGYFQCAHKMMDLLNQIFGWSHVAGITCCFYYILSESNWLYIHFCELSLIHRFGKLC